MPAFSFTRDDEGMTVVVTHALLCTSGQYPLKDNFSMCPAFQLGVSDNQPIGSNAISVASRRWSTHSGLAPKEPISTVTLAMT